MEKQWRIAPHDADRIESLRRATGLPGIVAQLMAGRGIDAAAALTFLDPKLAGLRDPHVLPGVPQAVRCIAAAIDAGRRIVIYGDYDADGVTGTSILFRCLQLLHADVHYYVPNRLDEGYGLNHAALEKVAAEDASLVITVDCGISSVAEAETAGRLGLELVITDHHAFGEQLPAADAIVHPRLPGGDYPFDGLCGAGVAFKLAWALCQNACRATRVSPAMREFLLQAVGLAAIGTVADVVPLTDENRIIVHHGLVSLRERPVLGAGLLMQRVELDKKPRLDSEDIAFMLAPRLNAAGRLGQASLAVELLVTSNQQRAEALADYIHELNKSRDSLERSVYLAANRQATELLDAGDRSALVLAGRGWHAGVIGIVAGRLAEKYHRPVLVMTLDESGVRAGQGSGRSRCGLNLVAALKACRDHLITCGGHAAAAGFKIEEAAVDGFREAFCKHVADNISDSDRTAVLRIDAEVPLSALTLKTVRQIERMAPFGQDNPRPLLCTTGVQLAGPPKPMGSGDRHLSLNLLQSGVRLRGVAFGGGEWAEALTAAPGNLAFAYRPVINSFRGMRKVEVQIVDWRNENGSAAVPPRMAARPRNSVNA